MDEKARHLLQDFIQEKLDGKLNNIRTFDIKTLRGDDKFGCPGRYFDCDDTEIMRAIYVVCGLIFCRSFPWIRWAMQGNTVATP